MRSLCSRQAQTVGQGYWLMKACVDQELEAREAVQNFKFKK